MEDDVLVLLMHVGFPHARVKIDDDDDGEDRDAN